MKSQLFILGATMCVAFSCKQSSLQPGVEADNGKTIEATGRVAAPTLHPKLIVGNNCFLRSGDKTVVITKTVSFVSGDNDVNGYHWTLPLSIDTVIIKANVKVTGGFKIQSNDNIFIKGESPTTSVLFGTNTMDWSQGRIPEGDKPGYSAITEAKGATGITCRIENLKIENSRIYAVTFRGATNKLFAKRIYILNSRGTDYKSNSDGIVAGSGSVIDDCYIDTWDDAIKFYYDNITVKNTTIVHNKNGAPFQLGWGSKDPLTGTIDNVKVIETIGESNANQALFCYGGNSGTCNTTIKVNKLQAPDYNTAAKLNMGDNPNTTVSDPTSKSMPIVGFKSFNAGCSLKLVGDNNQDIKVKANAGYQSNATASAKADKICSNSTGVNLGSSFNCASATGCSWK